LGHKYPAPDPDRPGTRAPETGQRLFGAPGSSGPPGRDGAARTSGIIHAQEVLKRFHGVRVRILVS
jgi:hypothetical protein